MKQMLSLLVLGMIACSPVEDDSKGGKRPDEDLGKLSKLQAEEASELMGSLGDVVFVSEDMAGDMSVRGAVDRAKQRQRLKASLKLEKCKWISSGSLDEEDFLMNVKGKDCPFTLRYEQNREIRTSTVKKQDERTYYSKNFKVKGKGVVSEIMNVRVSGSYRYVRKKNRKIYRTRQVSKVKVKGQSRLAGNFSYNLLEKWVRRQKSGGKEFRLSYDRQDSFAINNDYNVNLRRTVEWEAGIKKKIFRVNGEQIKASEYQEMLQDMNMQVGMERFSGDILNSPSTL